MRRREPFLPLQQRAGAVAAAWILSAGLIGFLGNVTSLGGAALVLGFGLVPPVLLMRYWGTAVRGRIRQTPRTTPLG